MTRPAISVPPRWNFCLFLDENCVRYQDRNVEPPVKSVYTNWQDGIVATVAEEREDGKTDNECEEVEWMYMDAYDHILTEA